MKKVAVSPHTKTLTLFYVVIIFDTINFLKTRMVVLKNLVDYILLLPVTIVITAAKWRKNEYPGLPP